MSSTETEAAGTLRHVIIGTAGHVDHGKTTLVHALTGTDTDRLAEEKARGMTIDLGFAFLVLPGDPPIAAGIVDVPGHERFVKNMLAGTGGVDVALLVVSVEEGPMPQTREHLDILTVLGVRQGVVALTKIDLADADLVELAEFTTRDALVGSSLSEAPIVPVSAATGEGLASLREALYKAALASPLRNATAPFRLPVDRVFSLPGVGTVVTGTLAAGVLHAGDVAIVQPQAIATRIRMIQTNRQRVDLSGPGTRVAVNLPGVEVGGIERGAVVCPPGALSPTNLLDTRLTLLPSQRKDGDDKPGVKHRQRVRVHLGTGEIIGRVLLLGDAIVPPGSQDVAAQIFCESLTAPAKGERFILRAYSPPRVIGGGIVTNPNPPRRYRRGDRLVQAQFDAQMQAGNDTERVYALLTESHTDQDAAEIVAKAAPDLTPESVAAALRELVTQGRAVALPNEIYFSDTSAIRLKETARRTLSAFHKQNPLKRTMPRDGLKAPLQKAAVHRDFYTLLSWLAEQGVLVVEGTRGVRLPEHTVVLPPGWAEAMDEILAVYDAAGFQPPSPDNFQANLPRNINVRGILSVLVDNGDLVRLEEGLYLSAKTIEIAKDAIVRLASSPEGITVGTVRDATGSSRKIVLPLLEHLDSRRFTRRVGDQRFLV